MTDSAQSNAKAWLETIAEIAGRLRSDDDDARDAATDEAYQAPLSIEVRSGWYPPGVVPDAPSQFRVLLTTGGPALQIVGDLDQGEPSNARLEWQDWGTPWTEYQLDDGAAADVATFLGALYFGE